MGYSEILCTICGVSFNIARIRTKDEPKEAAWAYENSIGSFLDVEELASSFQACGRDSGCTYYNRDKDDGVYKSPWKPVKQKTPCQPDDVHAEHDDDLVSEASDTGGSHVEHVAGAGCKSVNGYNGHLITAEEMQGCTTFQCLVHKDASWQPASDDEDFECDPEFPMYLSGLCDSMPDREVGSIDSMYPMRHDMETHTPDHIAWDFGTYTDYSLPFHPSCLEIYKRASAQSNGVADMLGLVKWHRNGTAEKVFAGLHPATTRADNIGRLNEQWWWHSNDSTYVAANPLLILGLAAVVEESTSSVHDIDYNTGAFDLSAVSELPASPRDPFAMLPLELRLLVLSSLSNQDISHLRLVSRAFRQLPISLWHRLVLQDMPWLWEAWPAQIVQPFAFLATTTERKLRASAQYDPSPVPVPYQLPPLRTNWYKLYCGIKRGLHDGSLKGLQNRKRIWTDCEAIVCSIKSTSSMDEDPLEP